LNPPPRLSSIPFAVSEPTQPARYHLMQRRFWLFGAVAVLVFLAAMYFSPGHFGLTKHEASNLFDAGVTRDGKGEIGAAIDFYDRAIRLNPDLIDAYNNRATDRRKQGNPEAAIADFSEVIRRSAGLNAVGLSGHAEETLIQARLARGSLLLERNALDDAAADFSAVLHSSDKPNGTVNLIRIELLKGNFEAAASRLHAYAVEYHDPPANGFYSGFLALFHDNDPHRAAAIFQKALTDGFHYRDIRAMLDGRFPNGDPGPWLSYGLPFTPGIYQMIVWQHVARQRAGDDDRSEFAHSLRQAGEALKRGTIPIVLPLSPEDVAAGRVAWPGPVIDLFLGLKTPEQLDAIATAAADPSTSARWKCDADFYSGLLALNTKSPQARALLQCAAENCPANALEAVAAKLELGRI
jgi:tetratricopeptide (TPR) repeat protein